MIYCIILKYLFLLWSLLLKLFHYITCISIYFMFSKSQTLSTSERLLTAWSLLCLQARTELHIQLESTVASFNLLHCIISTNSFFKIHIIVDMVDSLILFIFIYYYMNFMNRVFSLTVSYWIQSGNRPARLHVPVIYNKKKAFLIVYQFFSLKYLIQVCFWFAINLENMKFWVLDYHKL